MHDMLAVLGLQQKEVLVLLEQIHGIDISERHFRRILNALGLTRRKNPSDIIEVATFVNGLLDFSGQKLGYRSMHLKCLLSGYSISREKIRVLLSILDTEGVEFRKRKCLVRKRYANCGSDEAWHLDSYDKLTPYGINGCIDGFSRYIVWMEASYTNSDPKVVGGYFLNAVSERGGCPRTVRADMGTENGCVRRMQMQFRTNYTDGRANERSFIFGTSTANTRIKSWWGIWRRQCADFWIEVFHGLSEDGHFTGYPLDKELIRFCFMKLIQGELDDTVLAWNMHNIRRNRHSVSPYGRLFMMYNQPQVYECAHRIIQVTPQALKGCEGMYQEKDELPCDKDVYNFCRYTMDERGWQDPCDAKEAKELYNKMRQTVVQLL
ncbi:hypothetical protein ScPMuIL_008055 [Solemya velum]